MMQPGRLAVVTAWYPPNVGGIERYTLHLCRALAAIGWQVTVLTSRLPGTAHRETVDGVRILRQPMLPLAGGRFPVPRIWRTEVRALQDELRDWAPDVYVLQSHLFIDSTIGARLARRSNTPAVLIEHGSGYVTVGKPITDAGIRLYEQLQARYLQRRVTAVFGVSAAAGAWWRQFGGRLDGIVHNGIDAAGAPPRDPGVRTTLGISVDAPVIAYAGRVIPEKGVDSLVTAFQMVAQRHPEATLVVAGDGSALHELCQRTGGDSRIRLLGARPHDEVLALLGAADIVAYPSRYPEGLPTILLEAGAMGCAVVATPMGGTRELVRDGLDGLICETDDQLAASLDQLLSDRALRVRLAASLRQRVRDDFDWGTIAARFSDRLLAISAKSRRP